MTPENAVTKAKRNQQPGSQIVQGVLAILGAAATALAWFKSPVYGIFGFILFSAAMIVLVVFTRLARLGNKQIQPAAIILMWAVLISFILTLVCVFTSAVANVPWPLEKAMFQTAVTERAEAAGLNETAKVAQDLSPSALKRLIEIGNARIHPGHVDSKTNEYLLSPITADVMELDKQGLIDWSMPRSQFETVIAKYNLRFPDAGSAPNKVSIRNIVPEDQELLNNFSYQLNDEGRTLNSVIIQTVVKQIQPD